MKCMTRRETLLIGGMALAGLAGGSILGCSQASDSSKSSASASSAVSSSESSTQREAVLENVAVLQDPNFGGVYLDVEIDEFNGLGFAFGDCLDIVFSNDYKLEGVPYFNGYYVRTGNPVVVGYPGYPHVHIVLNNGDPLWDISGLTENDTATVRVSEAGAFRTVQEALEISYTDVRSDYASDEQFANFRMVNCGNILDNTLYRSASPIDNEHGRVPYAEKLVEQAGVSFILDLSDNADEIATFISEDDDLNLDVSYFTELLDDGRVALLDLSSSYPTQKFAQKLADGLIEMAGNEGPYLVHCVEGKDRTGFVCILLEALAGATYDEMLDDYMITYDNYYGINRETKPEKFEAIANLHFDGMLSFLAKAEDDAGLRTFDYAESARAYLRDGGMTDEQIDALVARLVESQ